MNFHSCPLFANPNAPASANVRGGVVSAPTAGGEADDRGGSLGRGDCGFGHGSSSGGHGDRVLVGIDGVVFGGMGRYCVVVVCAVVVVVVVVVFLPVGLDEAPSAFFFGRG